MSKVSEAKAKQKFTKDSPKCTNCKHFKVDRITKTSKYHSREFVVMKNLRCGIGGFKVMKSSCCGLHEYAEAVNDKK